MENLLEEGLTIVESIDQYTLTTGHINSLRPIFEQMLQRTVLDVVSTIKELAFDMDMTPDDYLSFHIYP